MKIKNMITVTAAVAAVTFGAATQAASFSGCVSTGMVHFDGSIVDAAVATPELSTLVDAVVAAGLADTLDTAEGITVYAPTNDAFAALPAGVLDAVVTDAELLTTVLTYHVSPDKEDPRRWISPKKADTLAGPSVFFHRQGGEARVNNAAVACQGVRTDNGTVWVIDSVLLP